MAPKRTLIIGQDCPNGHMLTPETTRMEGDGRGGQKMLCIECRRIQKLNRPHRNRRKAVTIKTTRAATDFATALHQPDAERPKCDGKWDVWTDYDEDKIPSPETAAALCEGCPFFELCRASAEQTKPAWGVQGGVVWEYGKINTEGVS